MADHDHDHEHGHADGVGPHRHPPQPDHPEPSSDYELMGLALNELLIEKLSRFRDEREFLVANVRIGAITRIFHESDPSWVIASYRTNAGLEWIRDGRAFLVLSEADGWRHAYVYSRGGDQQTLLTPGSFDIIERGVVTEAEEWFYYSASPDNATQKYLYRVRLDGAAQDEKALDVEEEALFVGYRQQ